MKVSAEELYRLVGEQLLADKAVEIPVSGGSMLPTLRPGRDRVRLERRDIYRKGDIVLARTDFGVMLHRIVAIDGDNAILMGDANLERRERCHMSDIAGVATAIITPRGERRPGSRLKALLQNPVSASKFLGKGKRFLWRCSAPARRHIAGAALAGVLAPLASLTFIAATKAIVDTATRGSGSYATAVAVMIGALLVQLSAGIASRRLSASATVRVSNRLRASLFSHLLRTRWTGRDRLHSGESVNRLTSDVGAVSSLLTTTIPGAVSSAVLLILAFCYLALFSWRMALLLVVIMPLALALSKAYLKVSRRLTREIREKEGEMMSAMQENLQHRLLISTLRRTGAVTEAFASLQSQFYARTMRRNDITLFAGGMVTLGFMTGYTVAFLWCAEGLRSGAVTFGVMTAFLQLVAQVQRPVVDLARQIPTAVHAGVSASRLREIEDMPVESEHDNPPLPGAVGVRFHNVSFRYPDSDADIIRGLTYNFTPSSLTAVTGETGAGKTTLLLLMLGVLSPRRGKIEIYNTGGDTEEVSEATRSNFVYVPQGNSLQSGTIRSNLLTGNPQATEEEMMKALHTAAADFAAELPEGLDTLCGERGTGLSEGQAQRIAIARGLLREGGVIVLDEPTSALDSATEKILMERLREAAGQRTIIIVTHHDALSSECEELSLQDRLPHLQGSPTTS